MDPEQNFVSVSLPFFTFETSTLNITVYHIIIILTEGYILSFQSQEYSMCQENSMSFLQNSIWQKNPAFRYSFQDSQEC